MVGICGAGEGIETITTLGEALHLPNFLLLSFLCWENQYEFKGRETETGEAKGTRIQSLPGKRILWRTISPMMHPTDHMSTRTGERA